MPPAKSRTAATKSPEEMPSTDSGIAIQRIYDSTSAGASTDQGKPGEYPFVRGIYEDMYRGRLWTMRQYGGYASAEETNRRFRYLLERGQTGLSIAFDLPTQMGLDSDSPRAEGEVGKAGVAIDSLEDMELLFRKIPLDKITTSMTINSTAAILLAFYITVAKQQRVALSDIAGTTQNDILKEYIARATYIYPPAPSMRLVTDIFEFCTKHLPRWNTISISGYHIREAGANAVQELAFTFANAIAYVTEAQNRGLNVDDFASRLSFFFACHNNFFEEIAKFRAARKIWANIMADKFNARSKKSMMLRFHTQTAGSTLTAQQPENNVMRVTLQALAAVLGGTQSLHTNSKDEALALPTEESVKIALRTQQIIAFESGVSDTVDPLGGSYFVENLTHTIEARVRDYLHEIETLGGSVKALAGQYFQHEIMKSAHDYQKGIENNEKTIVGVNRYVDADETALEILRVDPSVRELKIRKLMALREKRDNHIVQQRLSRLRDSAKGQSNLMPIILECAEAYATLGEISDVLRGVFGTYAEN